jgi:predicted RNase H-like HicB family nuclease
MTINLPKNIANDSSKLNYSVLVEAKEGGYQAAVWGLPEFQVFAQTREDALSKLHELVNNRFKNVEIIIQEIEAPKTEHPWMKFVGMFKDAPMFDEVLTHIDEYRREIDAEMAEYYRKLDVEEGTEA